MAVRIPLQVSLQCMRHLYFILLLSLLGAELPAQDLPRQGILMSKDKALFFFDYPQNAYFLFLEGEVDLGSSPIIEIDSTFFCHYVGHRSSFTRFGKSEKSLLIGFLGQQLEQYSEMAQESLAADSRFETHHDGSLLHFWSFEYTHPQSFYGMEEVTHLYALDFVYKDLIFHFCVPSTSGDALAALDQLLELHDRVTFLDQQVDVKALMGVFGKQLVRLIE